MTRRESVIVRKKRPVGFLVQRRQCATCIYRPDSALDLAALEQAVADPHMPGFFAKHRTCHHASDQSGVCCRGFWDRHKDAFAAGQIAQRLNMVAFVDVDRFKRPWGRAVCRGCGREFDRPVGSAGRYCTRACYENPRRRDRQQRRSRSKRRSG